MKKITIKNWEFPCQLDCPFYPYCESKKQLPTCSCPHYSEYGDEEPETKIKVTRVFPFRDSQVKSKPDSFNSPRR